MIETHDVFHGANLKVEWAYHHITTLKDTLNAFMKTDFYRVHIEEDVEVKGQKADPPIDRVEVEVTKEPPSEIPLIIGDVVHNLRSALDLATCEMIEGFGGKVTRDTHFPIGKTRKEVVRAVKQGAIDGAPGDLGTYLIEIVQPYAGGDNSLWPLHRLDILDKHRMIIPTFIFSPLILTEGGQPTGPNIMGTSVLIPPRRGEVNKQIVFGGMKLQPNYKPMIFVFLHDFRQGFPREDVFLELNRLAQGVSENLEALAKEYVALRNRTLP